jgi:hypothetical protein
MELFSLKEGLFNQPNLSGFRKGKTYIKEFNMKKSLATLTFIALALSAMVIPSLMSRYSTSAEAAQTTVSADLTATGGVTVPNRDMYALNTNNVLLIMPAGTTGFTRLVRLDDGNSNFIGIDFRPANNQLYALTDTGILYTVGLGSANLGVLTKVSTLTPRFDAGYQALVDFNPVVDAIRLIGSDNSNYAVVKDAAGVLNTTAVQTALTYPAPDVNAGRDPNISCGAYTNNVAGAAVTIFYAVDYSRDQFVTIPPAAAGGSSATGGGLLQTIGNLVTPTGQRVNISATADCDVFTNANGVNFLVGVTGRTLFSIDLTQINTNLVRGQTQNVVVRGMALGNVDGGQLCDIAIRK